MADRFWAKVDKSGDCWLWTASCTQYGYGQFFETRGRMRQAHAVAYELIVGSIPDGMELDHLCRVRRCVRPDHLEPVTHLENVHRGEGAETARRRQQQRTHCKHGHLYDETNTLIVGVKRQRRCRTCYNAYRRDAYRRGLRS